MHVAQTSVVHGDQAASDNDLILPAINAARLIQFRSSHQRADQSYAVIASAPAGRRNNETDLKSSVSCSWHRILGLKKQVRS